MKILEHNHVIMCDIDSTLIIHELPHYENWVRKSGFISVIDPLDETQSILVRPNHPMIRLLKEELAAGYLAVVWSKGRYQWAKNVLVALGIDHPNIVVMSKPSHYLDDKPCQEWMGYQVYLSPTDPYKSKE